MQENLVAVINLKSYLTNKQLMSWIFQTSSLLNKKKLEPVEVIICPPFTHILPFAQASSFSLGMQDISAYGQGAYTGEVSGAAVFPDAQYVLLGHSERRRYCNETTELIERKNRNAAFFGLKSIVCVTEPESYQSVWAYAYEPIEAIGTGKAQSAREAAQILKSFEGQKVLYGGSVTPQNVGSYIDVGFDGVLVASSALKPTECADLIETLSRYATIGR